MNFYQQKQNFICGPTKTQVDVKKYETTISAKKTALFKANSTKYYDNL